MRTAWGFRIRRIEWCDRHFRQMTRSDHAQLNTRIRLWSALDWKAVLCYKLLEQALLLVRSQSKVTVRVNLAIRD